MRCRRAFLHSVRPILLTWMLALGAGPISAATDEPASASLPHTTPVSLAGVDLVPAGATALYPGGTSFAFIGAGPDQATVTDAAGVTIRGLGPGECAGAATLLAWDGRDESGVPFRGRATLSVVRHGERATLELRPQRRAPSTRPASGVSFVVRATAP